MDATNQFIDKSGPWNLVKTKEGKIRLTTVMYNLAECLRTLAVLIYPFMPSTAGKIMEQLGVETPVEKQGMDSIGAWGWIKPGHK